MKKFWNAIAKGLAKTALWAASHPEVIQAVIDAKK